MCTAATASLCVFLLAAAHEGGLELDGGAWFAGEQLECAPHGDAATGLLADAGPVTGVEL